MNPTPRWQIPHHGAHNPSSTAQGTTPGSFALQSDVGGALAFASPDTPGMPAPSVPYSPPLETAFLPDLGRIERAARLLAAY